MQRLLFSLFFLPLLLSAEITLQQLEKMPRSYAKDFYIWRFFDQNITSEEADKAFYQIRSVNWKLIRRYAEKTKMPGFAMAVRCYRLKPSKLPAERAECSAVALTPYKFTKLPKKRQFRLVEQLENYPDLLRWTNVMISESPFYELVKSDADTFFEVFNNCGRTWREEYLDHPLPPSLIKRLASKREFSQTIKLIVTDNRLTRLQRSLLGIDSKTLDHQSTFFLAMNALRHDRAKLAGIYLADAYNKAWYRFDKDKTLFWLSQLDPKGPYLKALSESFDLNIYTLYAHEKLKTRWPRIVRPKFGKKGCDYNISDPFAWLKSLKEIKRRKTTPELIDYGKRFACSRTEGHYCFVMERASRYRTHYFPIPYEDAYEGMKTDDKALMLALARQESRFIPSSISPSYALGMMQIMPFLVKALAKERHEPFDLDAMLIPRTNISYARTHLKYLKRHLWHPLFISYAYNGGIGFTKRLLTERGLFEKGPYEPWLSMELVYYDESRRYGKKVLANYIVYKKILGEPIGVASAVETLTLPNRTDRFRSR
ncbi:lytic transglycosylase domain-containing protein [Hydrogenimonas cancrithermarum]|uniref:Transglycosylase n=1 Tax=Hydrogenimonas cancrithermarum TaxID=2993563 RepID=A0ABM8FPZ3_9BACT|nr:lytic transglycosylase domain-containing protein [Hydrogenimonas cancrithermarum]BDY13938.1 transglycosylase [Hydrogenimonas cancrithermarum]